MVTGTLISNHRPLRVADFTESAQDNDNSELDFPSGTLSEPGFTPRLEHTESPRLLSDPCSGPSSRVFHVQRACTLGESTRSNPGVDNSFRHGESPRACGHPQTRLSTARRFRPCLLRQTACARRMRVDFVGRAHSTALVGRGNRLCLPGISPGIGSAICTLSSVLPFPFVRQTLASPGSIGASVFDRDPRHGLVVPAVGILSILPVTQEVQVVQRTIGAASTNFLNCALVTGYLSIQNDLMCMGWSWKRRGVSSHGYCTSTPMSLKPSISMPST